MSGFFIISMIVISGDDKSVSALLAGETDRMKYQGDGLNDRFDQIMYV